MLETKYKSKFITMNYDEEKEYLETIWNDVDYMEDKEIMDELKNLMSINHKYKPKYSLTDESKKQFGYSPEVQVQMASYLKEANKAQFKSKTAMILSTDLIAQLSLEQFDDESSNQGNLTGMNFFTSREEALEWLFA